MNFSFKTFSISNIFLTTMEFFFVSISLQQTNKHEKKLKQQNFSKNLNMKAIYFNSIQRKSIK